MRYREITSHPYTSIITIDPCEFHRFERLTQDRDEIRLLRRREIGPDKWSLHVGCASSEAARRIADEWG